MKNKCKQVFSNMKYRCNNPKDRKYKYYGGKGIKCRITYLQVCYLWERDKASEMKRPSIDRIDANKDYVLENCRFIEMIENIKRTERKPKLLNNNKLPRKKYAKVNRKGKQINILISTEDRKRLNDLVNYGNIEVFRLGMKEAERRLFAQQ